MTQKKFSEQSWQHREKTLGDIAETAFTSWAEQTGIKYVRWGLERPPLDVSGDYPQSYKQHVGGMFGLSKFSSKESLDIITGNELVAVEMNEHE